MAGGYRACLGVPMFREGEVIGAIFVARRNAGLFTDSQVQLLKTFADQAVIAIENVRLFTELETRNRDLTEALEQQTATSEILRVISRSQTDVQPVFDTIAAAALKLCDASAANARHATTAHLIHMAAVANVNPEASEAIRKIFPRPPSRDTAATRAILTHDVVAIPDVLEDPDYSIGSASHFTPFRSVLSVPLIRDRSPIGAIAVGRPDAGPFPDKQVDLLKTFADQAVIAIENVRLFKELEVRNRDLVESLEQQTATSDILRAISRSPTDVQPVFDTIAQRAGKLCDAEVAVVSRFDGTLIELAAIHGLVPEGVKIVRTLYPMQLDAQTVTARVIRGSAVVHIADVLAEARLRDQGFCTGGPLPQRPWRTHRPQRPGHRVDLCRTAEARPVRRLPGRAAQDLRRPGGHRDRERAPVHRTRRPQPRPHGGAGAADGDERNPARDQRLADRRAAGVRRHRAQCGRPLRQPVRERVPVRRRADTLGLQRPVRRKGAGDPAEHLSNAPGRFAGIGTSHTQQAVVRMEDALADRGLRSSLRRCRRLAPHAGCADAARRQSDRRDRRGLGRGRTDSQAAGGTAQDVCRPGVDRDRERPAVQGAGSANHATDAIGRRTEGAGRGRAGGQLDAGSGDGALHHRLPRHRARRHGRRRDLRVRRDARGVLPAHGGPTAGRARRRAPLHPHPQGRGRDRPAGGDRRAGGDPRHHGRKRLSEPHSEDPHPAGLPIAARRAAPARGSPARRAGREPENAPANSRRR